MNLAEVFKALGDENRLRILNMLLREQLCVCEIETILGITQSNASRHLNKLKSNGIISCSKNAQWVYYQVDDQFKGSNQLLYRFLEQRLSENVQCVQDVERLEKYKTSCYTCAHLREDKNTVLHYLKQG